ncbi:MAG TPA: GtrA family protein [Euzebyales bacterium]|nr:GtrA family protein [Euzebyales bacterium]
MTRQLPAGRIRRAAHFGVVSLCSIVGTQLALVGLQLAGLSPVAANALAVTLAAILTYLASRRWVWRRSGEAGGTTEVLLYGLTTAVGFVLSTGLVWLLVAPGDPVLYASAVNVSAFGAVWIAKYVVLDTVVFVPRPPREPSHLAREPSHPVRGPSRARNWTPAPPPSLNGSRRWSQRPWLRAWPSSTLPDRRGMAEWWGPMSLATAALLLLPIVTVSALAGMEAPDTRMTGYPGRPGASEGDQEADLGGGVAIDRRVAAVERAKLVRRAGPLEEGRYLKVTVTVENTSDAAIRVRTGDWRVRTPAGHEYEAAVTTARDITDRRVKPGARAEGRLFFEVGDEQGVFYVMHAPNGGSRGVWRVVAER